MVDASSRVVLANDMACTLLGDTREELLRAPIDALEAPGAVALEGADRDGRAGPHTRRGRARSRMTAPTSTRALDRAFLAYAAARKCRACSCETLPERRRAEMTGARSRRSCFTRRRWKPSARSPAASRTTSTTSWPRSSATPRWRRSRFRTTIRPARTSASAARDACARARARRS